MSYFPPDFPPDEEENRPAGRLLAREHLVPGSIQQVERPRPARGAGLAVRVVLVTRLPGLRSYVAEVSAPVW